MSLKLFSCLFLLSLGAIACEGDARNYFRNPNYRDLYYQNQFYGGLANPKPVSSPDPVANLRARKLEEINEKNYDTNDDTEDGDQEAVPEDIYSFTPASGSERSDAIVLRPVLVSLRRELLRMAQSQKETNNLLKSILSVNNETLAWEMTEATKFYSLISSLAPSY